MHSSHKSGKSRSRSSRLYTAVLVRCAGSVYMCNTDPTQEMCSTVVHAGLPPGNVSYSRPYHSIMAVFIARVIAEGRDVMVQIRHLSPLKYLL